MTIIKEVSGQEPNEDFEKLRKMLKGLVLPKGHICYFQRSISSTFIKYFPHLSIKKKWFGSAIVYLIGKINGEETLEVEVDNMKMYEQLKPCFERIKSNVILKYRYAN